MKKFVTIPLLGLLAIAACTDRSPMAPEKADADGSAVELVASMSFAMEGALRSAALDDINSRIVPGFTDEAAAVAFRSHIKDLDDALAGDDAEAARSALALARRTVDPNGDGSSITAADRAEIAVILLVLEQIEQALD